MWDSVEIQGLEELNVLFEALRGNEERDHSIVITMDANLVNIVQIFFINSSL